MDRLTLTQNTTLTDIAKFMERQDQTATILAKNDDQGNTVLYTREANQPKGFKGLFTELKDKWNARSGNDKASVAQREIQTFVQGMREGIVTDLTVKADQAKGGHQAVKKLGWAVDYTAQLQCQDKPTVGQMTKTISGLELLQSNVSTILDDVIAMKDDLPPLPPTTNKTLGNATVRLDGMERKITTPDLQIGGKTYTCDQLIGTGGGGTVYSHQAQDGSKLAVKFTPDIFAFNSNDLKEKNEAAQRELGNNTRVMGGNPHVTGFTQHVMMDNGTVALVGEIMPNDDLTKMGEVLKNAHFALSDMTETPSGMIGDLEQKLFGLTLLQDAANGLAKMNDEKGVTHGHTKSQNVMIDKDGVAKVIDLGESAKTDKVSPGNYKFPDNPLYRASETTKLLADEKADRKDLRTANAETFDVMMEGLMEAVGLNPESLIEGKMEEFSAQLKEYGKEIATDLRDFAEVRQNSSKKVGNTFDSFGLGTIGFELLVGRRVTQDVEAKFSSDTMKNVESWRERGTDAIGEGGLTARSSGDPEIDRLLNGMLKSDPKERLTAAEVRDDAVMKTPGVGSPEVRELIKALASGDAGKIDAARDKVREKFGKIV